MAEKQKDNRGVQVRDEIVRNLAGCSTLAGKFNVVQEDGEWEISFWVANERPDNNTLTFHHLSDAAALRFAGAVALKFQPKPAWQN